MICYKQCKYYLNDGLDSAKIGHGPLDVLDVGLSGAQGAAAVLENIEKLVRFGS
jgi:hypothetical protein